MPDPYEVLGLQFTASAEEIKQTFRRLAREWHPDLRPPEERDAAHERMEEINLAYALLSDPEKRRAHDYELGVFRCFEHPGRAGVARCAVCETGMCKECARLDEDTEKLYCPSHAPEHAVLTHFAEAEARRTVAAKPPCWLHHGVMSVTNCTLCSKALCTKCVVFLNSRHYCESCAAAWRKAQEAEAHEAKHQRQASTVDREREAIAARQRLRNLGRPPTRRDNP